MFPSYARLARIRPHCGRLRQLMGFETEKSQFKKGEKRVVPQSDHAGFPGDLFGVPDHLSTGSRAMQALCQIGHIVLIHLRMKTGVLVGTFGNRPSMSEPAMRTHPCEAGDPRRFTLVVP